MKARLVDLIGSSGIENATSAQPKNLACAPRLSPLPFFGGVAGDKTRGHVCTYVFRSTRRNNVDTIAKSKPHTLKLILMFNAACMLSAEEELSWSMREQARR